MRTISAHRACGLLYRFVRQYPGVYLVPANVCPVVPLTLCAAGISFEFVDIDEHTLCANKDICIERLYKPGYAGVIYVRTYGFMKDEDDFFDKIHLLGKKVVDDRCLCLPEIIPNDLKADMTLYSTGYAKCVDLGGGAFAHLQDGIFLLDCELEFNGVDIEKYYKPLLAEKRHFDEIPNGWLDISLDYSDDYFETIENKLPEILKQKNRINSIYKDLLPNMWQIGECFNGWRFQLYVENKTKILQSIFKQGLFASSHYQPSSMLFTDDCFPIADSLYNHVINLFNDQYITEDRAVRVAKIIVENA